MPSWWDRFGEEWARQGLTDDPTLAQSDAGWAFIGQAPPTVEQFNTMFQWSDDKDNWLYGQIANCIIGSGVEPDSNDLMQLWNAIKSLQRRKLNADTAFYVDAINGNDVTGAGGVNSPWKTIDHAIQFIYQNIDPSGYAVIIQLAPGTYTTFTHNQPINGILIVQGDRLNPRAYLIKNPNGSAVACVASAVLFIQGIALEGGGTPVNPYDNIGVGVFCDRGGLVLYDCIAFGPCGYAHWHIGTSGYCWPWNNAAATYSIYGAAQIHGNVIQLGVLVLNLIHITITGNPNFSISMYYAGSNGIIGTYNMVVNGGATGKRYAVDSGGLMFGVNTWSVTGTSAGTVDAASYGWVN